MCCMYFGAVIWRKRTKDEKKKKKRRTIIVKIADSAGYTPLRADDNG